jgi:hypothetical protein
MRLKERLMRLEATKRPEDQAPMIAEAEVLRAILRGEEVLSQPVKYNACFKLPTATELSAQIRG